MTIANLLLIAALLGIYVPSTQADEDAKKLQGTWTVFRARRDGEIDTELVDAKLVIAGKKFTSMSGEKTLAQGTWKIDAGKKPKSIDIEYTDGPEKGQTVRGIYTIGEGTWLLLLSPAGQDRPLTFKASSEIGSILLILKSDKPSL